MISADNVLAIYEQVADTYKAAATQLHMPASVLQAITSIAWRNMKGAA